MIYVENLVKNYNSFEVLKNISLKIDKGEIIGLLGPNGAGKTTLMRILTGYMPATDGTTIINDLNIKENLNDIKKIIGYLPENCPLYPELTVSDFLTSMARLNGVPSKKIKERIDYVLESVKITDKRNKIIATLSKGYKQRVGLAQSLIHDPLILILDEPTVGLDPVQVVEIRNLIKNLKGDRTVILSSHILSEVSQTCERIIIISNGNIVAQGTEEDLLKTLSSTNKIHIQVKERSDEAMEFLQSLDDVQNITIDINHMIQLEMKVDTDSRSKIAKQLIDKNFDLLELRGEKMTLEEIFINLTQQS